MFHKLSTRFKLVTFLGFIAVTVGSLFAFIDGWFIHAYNTTELRNPDYYNDLIRKINDAYNSGRDVNSINNEYDCDIVLYTDADYGSKINDYNYKSGLIVEFVPSGRFSIGRVRFELSNKEFNDDLLNKQKRSVKICIFVLLLGYTIVGVVSFIIYNFYRGAELFDVVEGMENESLVSLGLEGSADYHEIKSGEDRIIRLEDMYKNFFKWLFVCLSKVVLLSFIVSGITLWVVKKGNISINKVLLGAIISLVIAITYLIYILFLGRRLNVTKKRIIKYLNNETSEIPEELLPNINDEQGLYSDSYDLTDKDKKSIILLVLSSIVFGAAIGMFIQSELYLVWFWICFETMVALTCYWNFYTATYTYLDPIIVFHPEGAENWPVLLPLLGAVFVDFVFHGFKAVGIVTILCLIIYFIMMSVSILYDSWRNKEERKEYRCERNYSVALSEFWTVIEPFFLLMWAFIRHRTR